MRHKFTFLLALLALAFQVKAQDYTRCMASPEAVTITQPDGSTLTVVGYGNMDVNYTETIDGYTVVKNLLGVYEYATQTTEGDLVPTGVKARENALRTRSEQQFLQMQPTHLKYSDEKVEMLLNRTARSKQNINPKDGSDHDHDAHITASFPSLGKRKVLMILIQYPDMKAKYPREDFENMMNQERYRNIGSYRDFYLKNSFGKLDLETDVMGWYTADSSYTYYGNNKGMYRTRELVAKALDAAEAEGVDFSQYDNDKDGQADGILIVHSGPGAEEGAQNQYIWSHRWNMSGYKRTYDNTLIDNYAINPETRGGSTMRMVGIGVFCHEFGHLLGLPDLYDVSKKSEGIGNWSVMAGGNWLNNEHTPSNFCAFTRTYMKWIKPVVIEDEGYYTLRPSSKDSLVYRINTPVKHEYFLLENRQLTGFDAKLNGKGMAIWHINDSVVNRGMGGNGVNSNYKKKGVDLEEADGEDDLDNASNRGDGGDLFPGNKKKYSFSDATTPSAQNYNGNNTGINVFNITTLPDSSVRFGYSAPPSVLISAPVEVCQNTIVNFLNNSKYASKFTWTLNNEDIDTLANTTYKFTEPGEQYVKLKGTSLAGIDAYDSFRINVLPAAVADFNVHASGYDAHITNNSQNAEKTLVIWGDGTTTTEYFSTVSHTYKDTGVYNVTMVCYSKEGCSDTTKTTLRFPSNQADVYPNPFRERLHVNFKVEETGPVSFSLYNILGQQVVTVAPANYNPGTHLIKLDLEGKTLPSGTYTLQILVNNKAEQVKVIKW